MSFGSFLQDFAIRNIISFSLKVNHFATNMVDICPNFASKLPDSNEIQQRSAQQAHQTNIPALVPIRQNVPTIPKGLPFLIPIKDRSLYCKTCKRIFIQKYYKFCIKCDSEFTDMSKCKHLSFWKKHGCAVCGQWFQDKNMLINHWDGHTTKAENFLCQVCRIWR